MTSGELLFHPLKSISLLQNAKKNTNSHQIPNKIDINFKTTYISGIHKFVYVKEWIFCIRSTKRDFVNGFMRKLYGHSSL